MSINVTVSGNPISIKKGKMVTIDSSSSKDEYEKRRLMRLEQVRQQSKNIAEDVRNKVRKEKVKQMKKIEEEGMDKLKNWKNRKLLELQSQYKEALKELGMGHKGAQIVEDENEHYEQEKLQNKQISLQKGKEAAQKLHNEKNQENLKKKLPLQYKKNARKIENTRANIVSNIKRHREIPKKKRKKRNCDINISIPNSFSDTDQFDSTGNENISPDEISISTSPEEKSEEPREPLIETGRTEIDTEVSSTNRNPSKVMDTLEPQSPQLDTRISDRIKKRVLSISQPDCCDDITERIKESTIASNTKIRETIASRSYKIMEKPPYSNINSCCTCSCLRCCERLHTNYICEKNLPCKPCSCLDARKIPTIQPSPSTHQTVDSGRSEKQIYETDGKHNVNNYSQEIPPKPPIKIKDVATADNPVSHSAKKQNKVQYYDHPNRLIIERDIPSHSYVEKLTTESTEVIPNIISENELLQQFRKREKEVQLRGKKALATEKVKRDYEEMLKKLPLLRKKEQMLKVKKDRPEYHMPDERLQEMEKIRQNNLENAFNKKFPNLKPAIVTLPKLNKQAENVIKGKIIGEYVQSLDLGTSYTDADGEPKIFSTKEVQEIVKSFTQQKPANRRAKLKELLRSLKLQKDELIKEIRAMSQHDESINELINDLYSFDNEDELINKPANNQDREQRNRKRSHGENDSFSKSMENSSGFSGERHKIDVEKGTNKQKVHLKTSSVCKKKCRNRPKVIILQNTSTQTTPVVCKRKVSPASHLGDGKQVMTASLETSTKICEKQHVPCKCEETTNSEELCHILINLYDEKLPAFIVGSDIQAKEKRMPEKLHSVEKKSISVETENIEGPSVKDVIDQFRKPIGDIHENVQWKNDNKLSEYSKIHKKQTPKKVFIDKNTKASWKKHLTKNSISTSSTSYMSPPELHKSEKMHSTTKKSFYELYGKPQQKNISSTLVSNEDESKNDELQQPSHLVSFIEKLLGRSRASIDNLNVSSVSTVTTPSQSLIELESNNPNTYFQKLIRQFGLKVGEITKELNYSTDRTPLHYNTSVTTSEASQKSVPKKSSGDILNDSTDSIVARNQSQKAILEQYAEITNSCSKRIASLAAMIQQIRKEKIEMLQNPLSLDEQSKSPVYSEKEFSTAYMDLPELKECKTIQRSSSSTSLSTDEEDILKKLLEVDLSLAKKLKKLKPSEVTKLTKEKQALNELDNSNIDTEINRRLEGLLQPYPLTMGENSINAAPASEQNDNFISFLSDIPKLPKFDAKPLVDPVNSHKRPPPSKGLSIVRKFNDNISLVPHELSTIVEADSQLSTRVGSGSPNATKPGLNLSPLKEAKIVPPVQITPEVPVATIVNPDDTNKLELMNKTPQNKQSELNAKKGIDYSFVSTSQSKSVISDLSYKTLQSNEDSTNHHSSSSDDIDTIEAMLKSIGMEWAIPTLHKTKEALALSSSSSSLELSLKNKGHGNDSSLTTMLSKHFFQISSSALISDTSPVSMFAEVSDMSVNQKQSKDRQRTSTPLSVSKSTSKSKECDVFSMESDISSVKNGAQNN